ncbi:hypothetical protein Tco_0542156 [Tanacetum coccineum]
MPLCCNDIHEVPPRASALAGCDRLVLEPLVIENNEFSAGVFEVETNAEAQLFSTSDTLEDGIIYAVSSSDIVLSGNGILMHQRVLPGAPDAPPKKILKRARSGACITQSTASVTISSTAWHTLWGILRFSKLYSRLPYWILGALCGCGAVVESGFVGRIVEIVLLMLERGIVEKQGSRGAAVLQESHDLHWAPMRSPEHMGLVTEPRLGMVDILQHHHGLIQPASSCSPGLGPPGLFLYLQL